jgi:uncharacterized membrane protein YoaK (UPF0700 family)
MNARPDPVLVGALFALTFATGLIDAVSFLALGQVFTANMTGNVALLGFAPFAPELSVPRSLTALALFVAGAMLGGRLAARMAQGARRKWIATAFTCEAAIVFACAAIAWRDPSPMVDERRAYVMIALLALGMGLRNATVRTIGIRDLATTVLTSSLSDLGMGIAMRDGEFNWTRAAISTLVMLLGAAAGALMLRASVSLPLLASGLCAAACALAVTRFGAPAQPGS